MATVHKSLIEFVFAALYMPVLFFVRRRPYRIVLFYHSVKTNDISGFRKQMNYLATNNYKIVKASEIKTAHANGKKAIAAITFDDGFISVIENALPVLKEYGFTATIFVPVGNLARIPRWNIPEDASNEYEVVMDEKQITEMDKRGFEILSHTVTHPALTEVDVEKLEAELSYSKYILETIIGHEVSGISYPHGAYNEKVCKAAGDAGYRFGFTIEPNIIGETTDKLQMGRFAVSATEGLLRFKLKVKGAYQVLKYLQAAKRLLVHFNSKK